MEFKYIKYKNKYLSLKNNIKGGGGSEEKCVKPKELEGKKCVNPKKPEGKKFVNPVKLSLMLDGLNKLDESLEPMENYVSETDFVALSEKSKELVIDCKYKSEMMNVFGTCWFIAITMTFFFSDTTRKESQKNLLQMIIKLKKKNLSPEKHELLKIIYNDSYYENDKLKSKYIEILHSLFLNLYKNLFLMLQCKFNMNKDCTFDNLQCHLNIVSEFMALFPNNPLNDILKREETISKKKTVLSNIKETNIEEIHRLYPSPKLGELSEYYVRYINLYSIILLESGIIANPYRITEKTIISKESDIIGYLIHGFGHVFCIFKCNEKFYKCDNSHIIPYDTDNILLDYDYYTIVELILNKDEIHKNNLYYVFKSFILRNEKILQPFYESNKEYEKYDNEIQYFREYYRILINYIRYISFNILEKKEMIDQIYNFESLILFNLIHNYDEDIFKILYKNLIYFSLILYVIKNLCIKYKIIININNIIDIFDRYFYKNCSKIFEEKKSDPYEIFSSEIKSLIIEELNKNFKKKYSLLYLLSFLSNYRDNMYNFIDDLLDEKRINAFANKHDNILYTGNLYGYFRGLTYSLS